VLIEAGLIGPIGHAGGGVGGCPCPPSAGCCSPAAAVRVVGKLAHKRRYDYVRLDVKSQPREVTVARGWACPA
jgi:hypothetical protein